MKPQWRQRVYQLGITTLLSIGGIFTTANIKTFAQLTPDNTLGAENSIVNKVDDFKDIINGGATRGANLFHSFEKFNVGENRSVYFSNPTGIENILTRVTGGNVSNILGTLGVEGTANLFLINPKGIYFGKDAVLDIRGSFTATTADEIKLGENGLFSATEPAKSNLLTVQPGVLFRNAIQNQIAEIKNEGNLQVNESKNLTFFAANVINTGTLTAVGGTVQLTGTENLIVRGNVETGTLLLDTKNLTIGEDNNSTIYQSTLEGLSGNTNLIFQATNDITIHPLSDNSLSLANGNSSITFTADGNFLMNAEDTIKTNGRDISISGASLTLGNIDSSFVKEDFVVEIFEEYIDDILIKNISAYYTLLGGGNITLTATQSNISTGNLNSSSDSDNENRNTGDGGSITITAQGNISTKSLDSSSYSDSGTAGNGGRISLSAQGDISTQGLNSYSYSSSLYGTGRNGGAISLSAKGNISTQELKSYSYSYSYSSIAGNGGAISLSAQGDISTQGLNSWSYSEFDTAGNGGAISLSAQGDIFTHDLNSYSSSFYSTAGNGGAISLSAQGDISTHDLKSYSYSDGNVGNGGTISLSAQGDISTQNLNSNSSSLYGTTGNGGAISLSAQGDISTQYLNSNSSSFYSTARNGGAISLSAQGDISTQSLYSSSDSHSGTGGNGGEISLSAHGDISTQYLNSSSDSHSGTGGNGGGISLSAQGDISTQYLNSSSFSNSGNAGNGGNITLTNTQGNIFTASLLSYSSSDSGNARNGGAITLTNTQGNIITQSLYSASSTNSGNAGNGGNITLKISEADILIPYINSSATGQGGNGGTIQFTGDKLDINSIVVNSDGQSGSNGGLIKLDAPWIQFTNSDLSSSSYGSGNSGKIELNSTGDINLNNSRLLTTLEPGSIGEGGNIQIQTQNLNLTNFAVINTGTYSTGNAGNININAQNISMTDSSSLQSLTADQGNAGNIFLNLPGGNIFLSNNSSISTSATKIASGNSGNIQLNSRTLSLLNGSQIQALTEGIGTSKAGEILVNTSDSIIINGVDPNFANTDYNALPPQNLIKTDYNDDYGNSLQQPTPDIGTNNSITTAQQLQVSDFYLHNSNKKNSNVEYSARVSYASINATGDDKIHVYAIKINPGTKAVFDIDNTGSNSSGNFGTPDYKTFPAVNTKLTLLDSQGQVLASNNDTSHSLGAGGSVVTMTSQQDPYLRYTFTQGGTYYIQVSNFDGQGVPSSYKTYDGNTITETSYDLQISLEPNPIQANINNQGQASGIFAYTTGAGKAGNINLNTANLKLENGGQISAFTNDSGQGGNININTNTFTANNGSQVLTTTSGNAQAGNINLKVKDNITLDGTKTGLFANTEIGSTGNSGSITIDPKTFIIKNGAGIAVNSKGSGEGGDISIAAGTLTLNNKGFITAETASNQGGEITLNIQDLLLLRNDSRITATAGTDGASGDGGNITINAPFIVAFPKENSDITANAFQGNGGKINITTNAIFGLEYRPQLTSRSDITASSQFGLSGQVIINRLDVDPSQGLVELPSSLIDAASQLVAGCTGDAKLARQQNKFTIVGRGGLPSNPHDLLTGIIPLIDLVDIVSAQGTNKQNITPFVMNNQPINIKKNVVQEAQGWIITADGRVILTAESPKIITQNSGLNYPRCKDIRTIK